MFVPSILLQDYISFEEISDYEVKAIIRHGGQTASGIFAFNEKYEFVSFMEDKVDEQQKDNYRSHYRNNRSNTLERCFYKCLK